MIGGGMGLGKALTADIAMRPVIPNLANDENENPVFPALGPKTAVTSLLPSLV